jgi:hypothetical protein
MRPQDMPAVRAIVRAAATDNHRFSSLVLGVVASPQFQMRTKAVIEPKTVATSQRLTTND